jgi:hypothetical protein
MQLVLFIPRKKYPEGKRLISLEIPVFSRFQKTNNRLLIRLKIYTHHPESLLPNEELGKINEVFEIEDTHLNTYSIDLERYRIILPQNGFYIGFELMGTIDKVVYNLLVLMRELGAPIAYSNELYSYYYKYDVNYSLGFIAIN